MAQLTFDIEHCNDCPFHDTSRCYTSDSFEMAFDFFCRKAELPVALGLGKYKKIEGYVDWHEKVKIPTWCPLLDKETRAAKEAERIGKFAGDGI